MKIKAPNPRNIHATTYPIYQQHYIAYCQACKNKEMAVDENLNTIPLQNLKYNQVEYIAGFWRVQKPHTYNIQTVRDKVMIIFEKLDHKESTDFNFYRAAEFTWNCYQILPGQSYVAAELFGQWGYGRSIEDARAFLGIKLYAKHQKLIHAIENRRTKKQNTK